MLNPLANLRILVIEDDPRMVELLRIGLWEKGHTVTSACTADDGQALLDEQQFDAIVLDIGLPGRSGYTILQHLQQRPVRPATIMLTALNQEDFVVSGLDAGADDYITKPFSFPELAARITSAVRRTQINFAKDSVFGPFQLDITNHRLLCRGSEMHLTRNEFRLLRELADNRGEVVPRQQLIQAIWGVNPITQGALDTLVNSLREKLSNEQPGIIATERSVGYSLADEATLRQREQMS